MSDLVGNPEDRFSRVAAFIESFTLPVYQSDIVVNRQGESDTI